MRNKKILSPDNYELLKINYSDRTLEEDSQFQLLANLLVGQSMALEIEDIRTLGVMIHNYLNRKM